MKVNKPSISLRGLLVTLICMTLSGCFTDCDFQSEPILSLSIHNGVSYTSGYALKNNIELAGMGESFLLPVALNDDRMVYTFHSAVGTDTLEVKYTKKVVYEDPCGFTLSLMDMETGSLTTFESVNFSAKSIDVQ